jgi:hypothetical protein
MIKYEYKRDVNRKHDRKSLSDLGGKGWELVLLVLIPLEVYDAFLDILRIKILKPNTVGIAISRCRC